MKFVSMFQQYKQTKNEIAALELKGTSLIKCWLFTALILVVTILPFLLILIHLFMQYSSVTPVYWIILVSTFLCLVVINPFGTVVFYKLLQNYYESEEKIQNISLKNVFFAELFNPIFIIIFIMAIFMIHFFLQ